MEYVKADRLEYPKCPHCDAKLTEVKFKDLETGGWFGRRKIIFFCPSCSKVLGLSDADTP